MKTFNFRKIVFINVLIALIFVFSGVHKYEAFAAEGCTAGQVVDYLAELTKLVTLDDNSYEETGHDYTDAKSSSRKTD